MIGKKEIVEFKQEGGFSSFGEEISFDLVKEEVSKYEERRDERPT